MLQVRNMTKRFGGLTAVNGVDLHVIKGEILSVIGPNGAGKTTFFNLLTGLIAPDEGEVLLDGINITGLSPDIIALKGIGRTFQNIRIFSTMTVLENVLVACDARSKTGYLEALLHTPSFYREEAVQRNKAIELLKYMALDTKKNELACNLSYGQQRRLEIARALALNPSVMLLDEPAAGMNPSEKIRLNEMVQQLRKDFGFALVLIEHDMKMVMNISDRIIVLDYGSKIAEGSAQEIQNHPRVIEAYLGHGHAGKSK